MSSGYFPLSTYTPEGEKLTLVSAQLRELLDQMHSQARELDCTEDGVADGWYLGRLDLAHSLIVEALRVEPPPQPCPECKEMPCNCIPF
jgi:hypothetical protein